MHVKIPVLIFHDAHNLCMEIKTHDSELRSQEEAAVCNE